MHKSIVRFTSILIMGAMIVSCGGEHKTLSHPNSHTIKTEEPASMKVVFENVTNDKIRESFMKVLREYEVLHSAEITLIQKPIKSSTMQAQPVVKLGNLFGETKKYRVKLAVMVRDTENLKVEDLPKEVLTGWFAHELGHLVDYKPYSNFQMIFYGLKYVFSNNFKREAEHAADRVAIRNGFRDEIIATKKFILEHDLLDESYKAKIKRYYMPIEEAEVWQHNHTPSSPDPEL